MAAIPNDHKFHWLTGDVNFREYGGTWVRRDDDTNFTIIEMVNMEDATGDISNGKYLAIVSEIYIDDPVRNAEALKGCGWTLQEAMEDIRLLIEAHSSYGSNTIGSRYGNNFYALLKWAKNY